MKIKNFVCVSVICFQIFACPNCSSVSYLQCDSLDSEEQSQSNEQLALLYLSCANVNLISQNYSSAFDDFQKVLQTVSDSNDNGIEFLTLFGMVIACDNLGLKDSCEQYLTRIKILIDSVDEEDDDFTEASPENKKVPCYLATIANMSPTVEIKSILMSFIFEIFPASLGSYSSSFQKMRLSTFKSQFFVAQPCKSFWKRVEKLGHNVKRTCEAVLDIIERCLDVRDRIQGKSKEKKSSKHKKKSI
jgi:hypothetical protein